MVEKQTDATSLQEFVTDESNIFHATDIDAVYFPESHDEVVQILGSANRDGTLITASAAGTGLNGGRVAIHGGEVISTEGLREPARRDLSPISTKQFGKQYTIYVDDDAMEAYVPAGLPLDLFQEMLPDGLLYPPHPTERSAYMGGTIATNASGPLTLSFGPTRDWVRGVRIVLPTGETMQVNRGDICAEEGMLTFTAADGGDYAIPVPTYKMPDCKNAAGLYAEPDMDLLDIFIGSEGILGIITEARVKLTHQPDNIISQIAFFNSERNALGFVDDMRQFATETGELQVRMIEFLGENALQFIDHELLEGEQYTGIYIEVAGELDALGPLLMALEENNCADDWLAETERDREEQMDFRHSLPDSVHDYLRRHDSEKLAADFVVPPDSFHQMLDEYHAAGKAFQDEFPRDGSHYIMFGHIGDYHLHFNFITHNSDELEFCQKLYFDLAETAVKLSGTISGEHGVGKKRIRSNGESMPYLQVMYGEHGLHEIARAKKAVDPNLLLNVGNMVPLEFLDGV